MPAKVAHPTKRFGCVVPQSRVCSRFPIIITRFFGQSRKWDCINLYGLRLVFSFLIEPVMNGFIVYFSLDFTYCVGK